VVVNDITDTLRISINRVNAVALDDTDNAGYIRVSALGASGYTEEGYDINGYDRLGYNRNGWDNAGYDRNGYDKDGYNQPGYNRDGYDKNGVKYGIGLAGPSGGYIFYDKGTFSEGWRFLEAAPESAEFSAEWDDAVNRCRNMSINGLGGWRLPDEDELKLMYDNLNQKGLGSFADWFWSDFYWSSKEAFNTRAMIRDFNDGLSGHAPKDYPRLVRAVRAF
jgi:hypothetical protein